MKTCTVLAFFDDALNSEKIDFYMENAESCDPTKRNDGRKPEQDVLAGTNTRSYCVHLLSKRTKQCKKISMNVSNRKESSLS